MRGGDLYFDFRVALHYPTDIGAGQYLASSCQGRSRATFPVTELYRNWESWKSRSGW